MSTLADCRASLLFELRGELGVGCEFHEEHNLTGTVDLSSATGDDRDNVNLTINLGRADANASRIQHCAAVAGVGEIAARGRCFLISGGDNTNLA